MVVASHDRRCSVSLASAVPVLVAQMLHLPEHFGPHSVLIRIRLTGMVRVSHCYYLAGVFK